MGYADNSLDAITLSIKGLRMKWRNFVDEVPHDKQLIWCFFRGRKESVWDCTETDCEYDYYITINVFRNEFNEDWESDHRFAYPFVRSYVHNLEGNHAWNLKEYYAMNQGDTEKLIAWMPFEDFIMPGMPKEDE
jgi:hypothetical protein